MLVANDGNVRTPASGKIDALANVIKSHGHWLRIVIAAHVPPGWPLQQAERAAWLAIQQQLPNRNPQIHVQIWLLQQAQGPVTQVLRELDRLAIEKRDTLTHLICESSLAAIEDGSYVSAGLINSTLAKLPQAQQDLLQQRYKTAAVKSGEQRQQATNLCNTRITCDWINASAAPFTEQSVFPRLIEEWLTQSIDADSRGLLSAQIAHDISRGALLVQQQRVHGALYGWYHPLLDEDIAKIIEPALGGQKKSGKSSIRTPVQPRPTSDATRRHQRKKSSQRLPAAQYQRPNNSAALLYLFSGVAVVIGLATLLYVNSGSRPSVEETSSSEATVSTPSVSTAPTSTTKPPTSAPAATQSPVKTSVATTSPGAIPPTLPPALLDGKKNTITVSHAERAIIVGEIPEGNSGRRTLGYQPSMYHGAVGITGGRHSKYDQNVVLSYRLPALPAGTNVSGAVITFNINRSNLKFSNLDAYLLKTVDPEKSGTEYFYHGAAANTASAKLIGTTSTVRDKISQREADQDFPVEFPISGEALVLLQSFYGGDNLPDQPFMFVRFNLDKDPQIGKDPGGYNIGTENDQTKLAIQFSKPLANNAGLTSQHQNASPSTGTIKSASTSVLDVSLETAGTVIETGGPSSKDSIVGEREGTKTENVSGYIPNAKIDIVGNRGSKGKRTDHNVVLGYKLPTLPQGAKIIGAEYKFEITGAGDATKLEPALHVYLLNSVNPDDSGRTLFYHGPEKNTEVAIFVGAKTLKMNSGTVEFKNNTHDIEIPLSGEALSQLQRFYGDDHIPDQPEAFFRFNLDKDPRARANFTRYYIDLADDESALVIKFSKPIATDQK